MKRSRLWLAAIAAVGLLAVSAGLVSQHLFGTQPCPWCVLQRLIFLVIAAVALLGLVLPGVLHRGAVAVAALLAGSGVAAALWQHFVAGAAASCNLTLADRIISTLRLDEHWPEVFMATASCAEAQARLLGLPFEFWSLGLFLVAGALAVWLLWPERRTRRR